MPTVTINLGCGTRLTGNQSGISLNIDSGEMYISDMLRKRGANALRALAKTHGVNVSSITPPELSGGSGAGDLYPEETKLSRKIIESFKKMGLDPWKLLSRDEEKSIFQQLAEMQREHKNAEVIVGDSRFLRSAIADQIHVMNPFGFDPGDATVVDKMAPDGIMVVSGTEKKNRYILENKTPDGLILQGKVNLAPTQQGSVSSKVSIRTETTRYPQTTMSDEEIEEVAAMHFVGEQRHTHLQEGFGYENSVARVFSKAAPQGPQTNDEGVPGDSAIPPAGTSAGER